MKSMWENYDLTNISNQYKNWHSLDKNERVSTLLGFQLLREYKQFEKAVITNKEYLEDQNLYQTFLFFQTLETGTGEEVSESLVQLMLNGLPQTPYIKGETIFRIAWAFYQQKNISIAKKLFVESELIFTQVGIHSLVWRSQLKQLICTLREGNLEPFTNGFKVLYRDYLSLPLQTRLSFSRFIIWLLLYQDKEEEAEKLSIFSLEKSSDSPNFSFEFNTLLKYQTYISLRRKRPSTFLSLDHYQTSTRSFIMEITSISKEKRLSVPKILKMLSSWNKNYDLIDRFHLVDILLSVLCEQKEFETLASVFKKIYIEIFLKGHTIYPRDIREFGLIAYKKTKQNKKFEVLKEDFERSSIKSTRKRVTKRLELIDQADKRKTIFFDTEKATIQINNKILSTRRKTKSYKLIHLLFSRKGNCSYNEILREVYPKESAIEAKDKLNTLCYRWMKKFLILDEKLEWNGRRLILSSSLEFKIIGQNISMKKNRSQDIISYALKRKTSFMRKDLESILPYSKRTIQIELSQLIKKGVLESSKAGRWTTYKYKGE